MTGAIEGNETLVAAAERMLVEQVSCLVAVEAGRPRGLVTQRELVRALFRDRVDRTARLDTIPWRPMLAAAEDGHPSDAVWLMESHALQHIPVSDDRGTIVGMLALEDALALVLDEVTALAVEALQSAAAAPRPKRPRRHHILEARDVQTLVPFVAAGASARNLADRLAGAAADLLIVSDGARMIGIVTERDLLAALVAGSRAAGVSAAELVSSPIVSVLPDEPLERVLAYMADEEIGAVGVAERDDCCAGVVSRAHLLTNLIVEMAARIELAEHPR